MKFGKRIWIYGGALLISVMWIYLTYSEIGIFYETNDDRHISEILSGTVTLFPEGHAVYLHYLLAKPLSWLYRIFPGVPWYGVFLIACHILVWMILLIEFWGVCTKWTEYLLVTGYLAFLYLCCVHLVGNIQYTSTAALLAACGYVCILMDPSRKRSIIFFALLETMAYCLRSQAMLMILPIGVFAAVADSFCKERDFRRGITDSLRFLIILLGIIGSGFVADAAAYGSPKWHEYLEFNQARTALFDYGFCPEYQEIRMILDRYDVSRTEYEAFTGYTLVDCKIPGECLAEIVDYVQGEKRSPRMPIGILKEVVRAYTTDRYQINGVVFSLLLFVSLCILVFRAFRFFPVIAGILLGEFLVWSYLTIGGRMPFRVVFPLFITGILLLSCVLARIYRECRSKMVGILVLFAVLITSYHCFRTGQLQYRDLAEQKGSREIMEQSLQRLIDYCNDRPDHKYIIGARTFACFLGAPLDGKISMPRNFIMAGTWYSNSPASNAYQTQYLANGWRDLYLIVYDGEEGMDENAIRYFQERTGAEPVIADRFTLPSGGRYAVYYFR